MPALHEAPVWIAVNGVVRTVLHCTPTDPAALAAGHLLAEGWVAGPAGIRELRPATGPGGSVGVDVRADADDVARADDLRRHQLIHGCGLRHFLDCGRIAHRQAAEEAPDGGALAELFRELFAIADAASPAGGVHAAALCDGATLRHAAVDVARHCAVDRAIGLACVAGDEPARFGLAITSRVSGLIAMKAIRANLRWIASRSVATPLAIELASAAGVGIHEQAARRGRAKRFPGGAP
ncbi:MAG TPA: formate dehydrogenase accessory sulfurtransferase FdhD [Longimicrobiales bacterium]|nr:formate dehydrogenase accessory sulfurtransferase FdhD [Longimicrobiales bacterium]